MARWAIPAATFAVGLSCGSQGPSEKPENWDEFLDGATIAKIGDVAITARDLDDRLRVNFGELLDGYSVDTERSIRDVLKLEIEHILLSTEAERVGFADTCRDFHVALEANRRNILQQLFTRIILYGEVEPSEVELRQRYDDGKDIYAVPRQSVIQHILVNTKEEAEVALRRLEAGEPINDVVADMTLDEMNNITGSVGWVKEGEPIRGNGDLPEFTKNALEMELGEYRIIQTKNGWHTLYCMRYQEAGHRPYEEVKETIRETLRRQRQAVQLDLKIREFRARYGARVYDENLAAYLAWRREKPESELWAEAQATQDPTQKISIYEKYLEHFPHSEHACEARFMIGFTLAEEIRDRNRARVALRDFIRECPDSKLVESAQFMMDDLSSAPR